MSADRETKASGMPNEPGPVEQRTLFAADLADPRARAAIVREGFAKQGSVAAKATSDVARARRLAAAGVAGAIGVAAAAALAPGKLTESTGPGPLTPSHVAAQLTCEKCHGATTPGTPEHHAAAKAACVSCHTAHPSTREGHRKATQAGIMGCPTCHTIHGPQQGVRFDDEGGAVRYGTDGEVRVPEISFHAGRRILVPIIPEKVCLGCHSSSPTDPFARCTIASLTASEGDRAPAVCFDEHQEALPHDASDVAARPDVDPRTRPRDRTKKDVEPASALSTKAVCADQHFPDRPNAWEAAREAAARVPWVGPGAGKRSAFAWLGVGGIAALLGYAGASLGGVIRGRRRKKKAPVAVRASARKRLPIIDTSTCLGCYACVDVCPYGVLEVDRYVAVVARPDACCGLVLCEQKCPNGSLKVTEGDVIGDRPRLADTLESLDTPGLYLGGDITGLPLIKNAIAQGAHAVEQAVESIAREKSRSPDRANDPDLFDVCIIGAGPAGISAALRAKELGAHYVVVEQANVAESIRSFPRGKLVFDQPLELPISGKLWLEESTKEELLLHWTRIVRREQLVIEEGKRVHAIDRHDARSFLVQTAKSEEVSASTYRARRVVVAIGRRGTPRKLPLPVPDAVVSRVHYHLADAKSFSGASVVISGLGDTAMEAAIALASAGDAREGGAARGPISVTILHRGATYSRGQTRNIEQIERLRKAGRLRVLFDAEIVDLSADPTAQPGGPGRVAVRLGNAKVEALTFDALFVLIGNVAPWDTLSRFGVRPIATPPPAAGSSDGGSSDGGPSVFSLT